MSRVVCLTDELVERYGSRALDPVMLQRLRADRRRAAQLEQTPPATLAKPRHEGLVWARDERIEFRPRAEPRFTIRLGYAGLEAIRREISWAAYEGVEMGGFLWAHLRTDSCGGLIVVAHVSPPADDSLHGRTSVRLGNPETVARPWPDWLARCELIAVGDVHSHPSGDGTPSRADRENWAWGVRQSGGFPWASLIVIRGEPGLGWSDPQFRGWITTPDGRGGFICEPAAVAQPY
jgi:JAB domain-containing protein similar to deubiquitination enzymes